MPERSIEHRAARMTAVATARQILGLPLGVISAVILARLYAPADVGRFGILAFVVSLPALVGDVGLSQAFIRRREDPSAREMALAASLQLWIAALAGPAILLAVRYAGGRDRVSWLALAALLYLPTLLGAIALRANVLTSRRLDFARLALLDLSQQAAYIGLLWALGRMRAGVGGLVIAAALTQAARTVVLAIWYPIRPAPLPRLGPLTAVVRSGLALHLAGIASGFHAGMVNWLGAPLFGPVAVGYLRWSLDITTKVGTGLAHAIGRVVYPSVALLQDDVARMARLLARAVRYNALLIGVPLALLAGLATPIITAVFGGRWAPASVPLQIFSLHMVAAAVLVPLDAAVKVVRPTSWSLGIGLAYLGVEVVLALALAPAAGMLAIPLAHLVATIPLVALLRRLLPAAARPAWHENFVLPLLALGATFAVSRSVAVALAPWPAMAVGAIAGVAAATAVVFALGRGSIWTDLLRDLRHVAPAAGPA